MNNDQYDKAADAFSAAQSNESAYRKALYSMFPQPLVNLKILDVGCGDGHDLQYFINQGAEAYGIDCSEKLLEIAKTKAPQANILLGNFSTLPYKENFFDIIFSQYALHHEKNLSIIFQAMHTILKPKGYLIILTPHPMRQFFHRSNKNYFEQELVSTKFFNASVEVSSFTHTFEEYFSPFILAHFKLIDYKEQNDPSATVAIPGWVYPTYLILKWQKIAS